VRVGSGTATFPGHPELLGHDARVIDYFGLCRSLDELPAASLTFSDLGDFKPPLGLTRGEEAAAAHPDRGGAAPDSADGPEDDEALRRGGRRVRRELVAGPRNLDGLGRARRPGGATAVGFVACGIRAAGRGGAPP